MLGFIPPETPRPGPSTCALAPSLSPSQRPRLGSFQQCPDLLSYLSSLKKLQAACDRTLSFSSCAISALFTAKQLRSPVGTHRLHCPPQSPSRPLQSGVLPHHPTSQLLEVAGSFRVAHSHVHFAVLILASQQHSTPSPSRKPFL